MLKLEQMLERQPDDVFLLYALGLEHKKMGSYSEALRFLSRVILKDPGYCVAYHQAALVHESAGDVDAARKAYRDGIAAADRKGDAHAKEEMQAALSLIE
jgi:Tfp pilus assembly protein PilF